MTHREQLLQACGELHAASLQARLPDVFNSAGGLAPAIHDSRPERPLSEPYARFSIRGVEKRQFEFINRRLGHIEVNPTASESTAALCDVYTLGTESTLPEAKWQPVNRSRAAIDAFVEDLVRSAKTRHAAAGVSDFSTFTVTSGDGNSLPGHFILAGPRGSGKTFFLNHVLSKYSDYFDDQNILWIRLNIIKKFGDDATLSHRVWAQTVKVLLRYYDPASEYFPRTRRSHLSIRLRDHILAYIRDESPEAIKEESLRKWQVLCNGFQRRHATEPAFEPSAYPVDLCQESFRFAQAAGFSLIVVFDGLDRLDFIPEAEERYRNLVNGCKALGKADQASGPTYLFVLRNTSLAVRNALLEPDHYHRNRFELRQISLPSVSSIVETRLAYLSKHIQSNLPTSLFYQGIEQTRDFWLGHLSQFNDHLQQKAGKDLIGLSIAGTNIRMAMQVVQATYQLFLEAEEAHAYLLTEVLVTRGERYPEQIYQYFLGQGKLTRSLYSASRFDSTFLPSLFAVPFPSNEHGRTILDPTTEAFSPDRNLLAGYRLLQLVDDFGRQRHDTTGGLPVSVIIRFLETYFDYEEQTLLALIEEYIQFECLFFVDGQSIGPDDLRLRAVRTSPKGRLLYQQYLRDVTYLSLAIMLLPCSPAPPGWPSYIRLGTPFSSKENLEDWISTKLINSLAAYRLLSHINNRELAKYTRATRPPGIERDNYWSESKIFDRGRKGFFSQISDASFGREVLETCAGLVRSLQNDEEGGRPRAKDVLAVVKRYRECWCGVGR